MLGWSYLVARATEGMGDRMAPRDGGVSGVPHPGHPDLQHSCSSASPGTAFTMRAMCLIQRQHNPDQEGGVSSFLLGRRWAAQQ